MSMRVLVCGGRNLAEVVRSIARGFQRIGCHVLYQPTRRPGTRCDPLLNIFDVLGIHVREFGPDVLFWCLCKQDCPEGLIRHLKTLRPEMKTVFHSFDDPYQIDESGDVLAARVREFDRAVTCCEGSVGWYEAQGVEAACIYPPPDHDLHGAAKADDGERCDASFAATHTYPRPRYPAVLVNRADMVRAAARLGTLHLYGYWGERTFDWGGIYGVPELAESYRGFWRFDELPGVFAASRVNLNSHVRPDGYRYLNQRALNVMASGGFLLCDRVNGIEELFEPGRDFDTFGDLGEFREKLKYWLSHDRERASVADSGRRKVWERYGNDHHARAVLKLCGKSAKE